MLKHVLSILAYIACTQTQSIVWNLDTHAVQIGWQFTSYQATEGTPTVQACAQVFNGAANVGNRTITLQVSTSPNTADGKGYN